MRDWFAGKALTGILADKNYTLPVMPLQAAELAYKYANAMLIHRAKNNTNNEN